LIPGPGVGRSVQGTGDSQGTQNYPDASASNSSFYVMSCYVIVDSNLYRTDNVHINVTLRHVRATIVAMIEQ